jgi:hypothetical protein
MSGGEEGEPSVAPWVVGLLKLDDDLGFNGLL